MWDKVEDTLRLNHVTFEETLPPQITKRVILSMSHKVFDPIGFSAPVLLRPKLLMQEICVRQLDWDENVDSAMEKSFKEWYQDLQLLKTLKIQRRMLGNPKGEDSLTYHVFVDASQSAYAAAIFVRTETINGVEVHMVEAKARVAPTKKPTIPRMELLAATMGVRLMEFISSVLKIEKTKVHYWSDSSTVLTWIKCGNQWATFVYNRVQEIRQKSDIQQWRHVPGEKNPADLPSRGCTVEQLIASKWWEGPCWLKCSPDQWPNSVYSTDENSINKELKKCAIGKKFVSDSGHDHSCLSRKRRTCQLVYGILLILLQDHSNGELDAEVYQKLKKTSFFP
ncbi:uncharacterized protein LOC127282109 [Leptopilina boulardi]|uniref:uncharacterized protein LOC127282109 n=1 Tax=Leptopilina boulardi TaxID=63433 RepID=UPI0021F5BAB8|nr:uncharacterized protein LOC127282109 [Leptopilina boulardi]